MTPTVAVLKIKPDTFSSQICYSSDQICPISYQQSCKSIEIVAFVHISTGLLIASTLIGSDFRGKVISGPNSGVCDLTSVLTRAEQDKPVT